MVEQVCSHMEAERGYQNIRKYYNLMRTQVGTFVTISTYYCFTCMQLVSGTMYNIALQLFANIYHLIYVENVGHVSIIN